MVKNVALAYTVLYIKKVIKTIFFDIRSVENYHTGLTDLHIWSITAGLTELYAFSRGKNGR